MLHANIIDGFISWMVLSYNHGSVSSLPADWPAAVLYRRGYSRTKGWILEHWYTMVLTLEWFYLYNHGLFSLPADWLTAVLHRRDYSRTKGWVRRDKWSSEEPCYTVSSRRDYHRYSRSTGYYWSRQGKTSATQNSKYCYLIIFKIL